MQAETPFELGVEFRVWQRDDARRLVRLLGPYDRRAMAYGRIVFQRQDRERSGREKMLLRAPVMVALMSDRSHNRRLVVAEAVAGNSRALADTRTRAVGSDEKPCCKRIAVGQAHADAVVGKGEVRDCRTS